MHIKGLFSYEPRETLLREIVGEYHPQSIRYKSSSHELIEDSINKWFIGIHIFKFFNESQLLLLIHPFAASVVCAVLCDSSFAIVLNEPKAELIP